jgi:hypothetical protein
MAGISGRMYCGRFDCESEKKTTGMASASSQKTTVGSGLLNFLQLATATIDHGREPASRYGTKYHGGPVRLSSSVAMRAAVSVTST